MPQTVTLAGLVDLVAQDPALASAVASTDTATLDLTGPLGIRPFVIAAATNRPGGDRADQGRVVLAVTATTRETEDLVAALESLLPPHSVAEFPAWETLPHERLSPRSDTVGRRLAVLRRLTHPVPDDPAAGPLRVIVAPVRSVIAPQVAGLGDLQPVALQVGDEVELEDVVRRLTAAAYSRVDMVERRGDFAVRGGIIDVFPPTTEHPLRVEFWGDTVEEIRSFAVADQRSLAKADDGLWAPPCRELLLTDEVRARARALGMEHPELLDMVGPMSEGVAVEGMESLAPALVDRMELLVELLPPDALVMVCDPERVRTRAGDLVTTSEEFLGASWAAAAGGGVAPIDLGAASYHSLGDVRRTALDRGVAWWSLSPFASDEELAELEVGETRTLATRAIEPYRGDTERAMTDVREWLRDAWRVVLVTEGHGPAKRLLEVLAAESVPARLVDGIELDPGAAGAGAAPGLVEITTACLTGGFLADDLRLAVLTEEDLVGRSSGAGRDAGRMPSRRRNVVDPLQLKPGDFVVHEQHGVGKYVEMVQRTVQGATREYLVIEYAPSKRGQPGDRLYAPTDALDQVTRYVGGEAPSLHRLGGSDWAKAKGRARKAVRQIAAELIKLYSARMAAPGFQFSPDTPWQRELEDAFPYTETQDQLASINEVKADMERPSPMDRLICGDVGYGKTEIAVRAAFKAVQDGKQVAILVPTTLLVQQHLSTFTERYSSFPVVVRSLSRFQTDSEAVEVQRMMAEGTVDVVIGTHRLLQSESRFKDLGLVIVDEEQRFGVEAKEYLKQLRVNVDVLTMSATPIPRTLEMAVTGIREMSTIQTPPEERHPVLTFVGGYDERQISAAIRRELLRDGQIFYVHNRVGSIDRAAGKLRELVPEARVAVAHGQMNEHLLEQVILDFWAKEFDVLVCTTIVESGLDIGNANTLVVERADQLGLGQLHQLRGRVGRGRERAYAYFLYPADAPLTETAYDRLATIAQHTDLGAGMAVAMRDLEIRGAGNLLGGEQSGHIAEIGFDLYIRLVGEAVADFRGENVVPEAEMRVELPINAHVPHDYVPGERLRLDAYRRLAAAPNDAEVDAIREELVDRYGEPPTAVENLLEVARFRVHARAAGLTEVTAQGNYIRFGPVMLAESGVARLSRLYPRSIVKPGVRTILVPRPMTARVAGEPVRDVALLAWCRTVITDVVGGVPATVGAAVAP